MKSFFNKLIDIISTIFSKLSILIIVLVLGLIVVSRLNNLFDNGIINTESILSKVFSNYQAEENTETITEGPAKIIYKGGKPSEEEIQAEEEFAKSRMNLVNFTIEANESPEAVANKFKKLNLISDPPSFIMMLENLNLLDKIEPGNYEVAAEIKNRDLISEITNTPIVNENISKAKPEDEGGISLVTFEILEGESPEHVAEKIKAAGLIQDTQTFVMLIENANLIEEIKPGIYRVPKDIKNLDLIESITIANM